MRKTYMKPMAEIEVYKLDAAIATNCGETVSLGPEAPGHTICDEFKDAFEVFSLPGNARAAAAGTPLPANQSIGDLTLINTTEEEAAVIMAITSSKSGIPLNRLKFNTIKLMEDNK